MRKKFIVDNRYFEQAQARWGTEYEIVPSATVCGLPEPVSAHPDLAFVRAGEVYIAEKTVYDYYKARFPHLPILCGETVLLNHYPFDIAYNVLISEKTAFANFKYMDGVLKNALLKQNFELINVKQGYAKCSAAVFGKNIITADPSIKKAAEEKGFRVLEISPGGVRLSGYEYGFIGGASGFADNKLLFFGDITKHKDYGKIRDFAVKNGAKVEYIADFPLTDVGTMIDIL